MFCFHLTDRLPCYLIKLLYSILQSWVCFFFFFLFYKIKQRQLCFLKLLKFKFLRTIQKVHLILWNITTFGLRIFMTTQCLFTKVGHVNSYKNAIVSSYKSSFWLLSFQFQLSNQIINYYNQSSLISKNASHCNSTIDGLALSSTWTSCG